MRPHFRRLARHAPLLRLAALVVALLTGHATQAQASRTIAPPLRVLFIGNSYTYYNNLPALVAELGRQAQPAREIRTRMLVRGGATLRDHWMSGEALAALRRERWDFVVLQEQSMLGTMLVEGKPGVNDPEFFATYARQFIREIRASRAVPVLYLTWSRRAFPDAQQRLTNAYAEVARETGAVLAPVGLAWQGVRAARPTLVLHDPDGTHPSPAGSYVAATTLLATLTGTPARGLPARVLARQVTDTALGTVFAATASPVVALADSDAALIQRAVDEAMRRVRPRADANGVPDATATRVALAALIAPVDSARLPALPAGAPLTWERLAGEWRGTMRLYDGPVEVSLVIAARDGGGAARWSVHSERWSSSLQLYEPELQGTRLVFTVADPRFLAPPERHWAVLAGDSLVGRAEVGGGVSIPHLVGAWTLRKSNAGR